MTTEQLAKLESLNQSWAKGLANGVEEEACALDVMGLLPEVLEHIKKTDAKLSEMLRDEAEWSKFVQRETRVVGQSSTEVLRKIIAQRDAAQADRDLNIDEHAVKRARLEAERDAAQKACAEIRETLIRLWDHGPDIPGIQEQVQHALSSDFGKGYHSDSEWEPVVAACKEALDWFEIGPADFTKAAEVVAPKLEQALAHAEKLTENK